ncbi:MAG: hypothetical protein WBK91_10700 [Alphaproteobacteria bacterium]
MAANSPFAELGHLASALSSSLPSSFMPESMASSVETGNTTTPSELMMHERNVLGSLNAVPLSIRDHLQRTRAQNEEYTASIIRIRNSMPRLGETPTAATLAGLHRETDALALAAGGPDAHMYVAALIDHVEDYIDGAETSSPQVETHVPEDTAHEPQSSEPGNDSGGGGIMAALGTLTGAMMLAKAPKVSLTKGGYTPLKSATKFGSATTKASVKPGIKPTVPGKKPPDNTI